MVIVTSMPRPEGTVTVLMTDIVGSTPLWQSYGADMQRASARHDVLIEMTVIDHSGIVVRPKGEGDSRFAVFDRASDAVCAAIRIQARIMAEPWGLPEPLSVRIGLHTGEIIPHDGDYYGTDVNRCARIRSVAGGGQVLLSQVTMLLARSHLSGDYTFRSIGEHRFKGLEDSPEQLYIVEHTA
jgi:class 3 adenylate cyclase